MNFLSQPAQLQVNGLIPDYKIMVREWACTYVSSLVNLEPTGARVSLAAFSTGVGLLT